MAACPPATMTQSVRDREPAGQGIALAGPESGQIPLPKFLLRQSDGIHVSLPALDSPTLFRAFIDRTFSSGLRFAGLDYGCVRKLLYEYEHADLAGLAQHLQGAGKPPTLRLATDIVVFPPERRQCYRDPKLIDGGHEAEYLFEPVMIESVVEEPVYGDPGPDGNRPVVDRILKTVTTRATLDVDEFIAAMWIKEIRYGIDVAAVQKAIAGDKAERVVVARMLMPAPGKDASVEELTRSLHRDDTPKLLADGRIDLHQFQNRFPQVAKDTRLLRKIPRVPGKSGWDLAGHELVAELPRDIDIAQVAGPGTRIERTAAGEFVVADMSGFLQIDAASGSISINDKIVNHEGVGLHTTGNLTLDGDEYEEHGEVQELSKVEGRNMSFLANVFGKIVSHGGLVVFRKNLNMGSVRNPGGTVVVEGNTSRATIEAVGGEITLGHAEGCVIIGRKVSIGHAIQCDVLAEELTVEVSEGCALAAQRLHVGTASARHDAETAISMLVPDLSAIAAQIEELRHKESEYEAVIEAGNREIEAIANRPEVKNYSILNARMRANEIHMTAEQEANWQKLLTRVTPMLRNLKTLNDELRAVRAASRDAAEKAERLTQDCRNMSAGIACSVTSIAGDTVVRLLKIRPDAPPLHTLQARELRARLRGSGPDSARLFSGSEGAFEWTFDGGGENRADPPS